MLKLNLESIKDKASWQNTGVNLPDLDVDKVIANTKTNPKWIHFGAGNIFRGFVCALQQKMLETGKDDTGIIAAETFDFEVVDRAYAPFDNLSMLVIMKPDGSLDKTVLASVTESLIADKSRADNWARLEDVFANPSLQICSFTITEKGYNLNKMSGEFFDDVVVDMENGVADPKNTMAKIASLAYIRYKAGAYPLAFVSMDNCSHNGEKLHNAVRTIVEKWVENGHVEKEFLDYICDESKVSFPWSMIDKITPRPSEFVSDKLKELGIADADIIQTKKNTFTASYVNAEGPEYLIIEDKFPNGRTSLEDVGVMFTDRETVNKVEKMKVCTCLNPLHTALAVFGCLLGHNLVADEMKDTELKSLVEKIGYVEGLPVVVNPGILNPEDFIKEVLEERFPNPFIPDTPQRIATDTSQKLGIRFGETIKAYGDRDDLDPKSLKYIPLTLAGWLRYLMAIDDNGEEFTLSPDPMIDTLKPYFENIKLGEPESVGNSLKEILSNESIFGSDMYAVGLGKDIEGYFKEFIAGKSAIRNTLRKYL